MIFINNTISFKFKTEEEALNYIHSHKKEFLVKLEEEEIINVFRTKDVVINVLKIYNKIRIFINKFGTKDFEEVLLNVIKIKDSK